MSVLGNIWQITVMFVKLYRQRQVGLYYCSNLFNAYGNRIVFKHE